MPLAAESLPSLSPSGTSSATTQQTPSPTSLSSPLLPSPSNSLSYTATFPQSASTAGMLNIRDSPQPQAQVFALGKARNSTHKTSRPSKDTEDPAVAAKRKKNSSHSSFSSSSLFQTVDNYKRNCSSFHSPLQSSGVTAASPNKKKRHGRGDGGILSSSDDWLSRPDGPHSYKSQNRWVSGS